MKTDGSLGALIQGVSQQPASTRLPGQCALQDNFSSNPVDGLTRRPPLEFISHLFTSAETPTFKDIALGTTSKYISALFNGNVRVWSLDGTEVTVNKPVSADLAYLDGSKLAFATLGYDTYIANKSKVTAMLPDKHTYKAGAAILSLLGGQYGAKYVVTVTWIKAGKTYSISVSHAAPNGTDPDDIYRIQSAWLMNELHVKLTAVSTYNFNTTFIMVRKEDTLYMKWADDSTDPFTITVSDDAGGTILLSCTNSVGDISKLPRYAPQGYYVKVAGEGGSSADDWYVQFVIEKDALGNAPAVGAGFGLAGTWKECVAADVTYKFDASTMPHALYFDKETAEFTYQAVEWKERRVGDDLTNPLPSFIGSTIYDMAHFQSRLVFTSGNKCIMSRTNKPEDFFVETATAQTDTDPIDIGSSVDGVSQMEKIVPHNRDLVIFAPSAQFIVFGRNTLTPKNSSLVLTTTFEASLDAQPVPAGKNVFFAIAYGKYVGVREFYTEGSADINDARPITQHVLKYIPGTAQHMAASSNFDILLLNAEDRTKVFAYEYIWLGEKKVQSSWSCWSMPDAAVYYWFVDSVVYVIMKRNQDYLLCKMDLDMQDDEDVGYQIKLDYRAVTDNVHTSIVPIVTYNANDYVFVQGAGCPHPGMRVLVKSVNVAGDLVELAEDMEGGTVIHGIRYMSRYQPTLPVVKDGDGVKVGTGKLRIGKFLVSCSKTGRMYVKKFSKFAADVLLYFSGRFVANPNTVVGEEVHTDNVFIVPFKDTPENADLEIYTDDYTPLTIETIEWIGQYSKRGRRITTGA